MSNSAVAAHAAVLEETQRTLNELRIPDQYLYRERVSVWHLLQRTDYRLY